MIRVRLQDRRGVCRDLPAEITVQGTATPELRTPRTGEARRGDQGGAGAPITPAHIAIAHSIARRTGLDLLSVRRSGRGLALDVSVGEQQYQRVRRLDAWGSTSTETSTRPRGHGWRGIGPIERGRARAIIDGGSR